MQDVPMLFKKCMEQTSVSVRLPFDRFARLTGFRDFVLDAFDVDREPKDIAAAALDELCVGDRRQTDQIVCLGVIRFLDGIYGAPPQDPEYQRLKDLGGLLLNPGTRDAFRQWADAWYD
jgi:hypothetical protein